MSRAAGSPMTGSIGGRHCPEKTLTGLSRTHASLAKLSLAGHARSQGVRFV